MSIDEYVPLNPGSTAAVNPVAPSRLSWIITGKARRCLPALLFLALILFTFNLKADPVFSEWFGDYSGSEEHTLLLWKFDSGATTTDSSGNGYTLSYSGTGTQTGVSGSFGEAFLSEGPSYATTNTHYAQSGGSAAAFNGSALTVEFWYSPLSTNPSGGASLSYLFDKKYSDNTGIQLMLSNLSSTTNSLRLSVGNGSASAVLQTDSLAWDDGLWYHIAVTYRNDGGDGVLRIYRNGTLLAESTASGFGNLNAGTRYYRLANRLGSSYISTPGYYDNFRVSDIAREFVQQPAIFEIGGYAGTPSVDQGNGFTYAGSSFATSQATPLATAQSAGMPYIYRIGISIPFVLKDENNHTVSETNAQQAARLNLDFEDIEDEIRAQVQAAESNPWIQSWTIYPDELRHWMDLEMDYLELVTGIIHEEDSLGRPVWMYEPNNRVQGNLQHTLPFQDLAARGTYVSATGHKDKRVWLTWVLNEIIETFTLISEDMPIKAVLEMYQEPAPADVSLIPTWVRHDCYASLVMGARSILIYTFGSVAGFTHRDDYYDAYAGVAGELNGAYHLGAVFLEGSPITVPSYSVTSGPTTFLLPEDDYGVTEDTTVTSLHAAAFHWWDDDYLFMVNSNPSSVTIQLATASRWKPLLGGQPALGGDGRTFTLPAWGVIALADTQEPYTDWEYDYTGDEDGTLLLWKFDSGATTTDASGNGYTVSFSGSGTQTGVSGAFGDAFQSASPHSTSNDSYAQGGGSAAAFNGDALSVEFWYQPLSSNPSESATIAYLFDKKYSDSTGIQMLLSNLSGVTNGLRVSVGNGTTSATLSTGSLTWDSAEWYHIAVTYENIGGDGFLRIYRDGEILAEAVEADFGDLAAGTRYYRLGNRLGSSYSSAPGRYDNFRVMAKALDYGE